MNMNRLCMLAVVPFLFATAAMAAGTPDAAGTAATRTLRVLVAVNSSGKVVLLKPASAIRPDVRQAVRRALDRAITQPARDATGNAVPSSFVVNFSLHTTTTANDTYKIDLAYVSMQALPAGSWTWCQVNGRQARLMNVTRDDACYRPYRSFWTMIYPRPFGSQTRVPPPPTHR